MTELPTWVLHPDSFAIIYLKRTRLIKESVILDSAGLEHSFDHNLHDPLFKSLLCKLETKGKTYVIFDQDDATRRLALFRNQQAQEDIELRLSRFQQDSGGILLDSDAFRLISYSYFKKTPTTPDTLLRPSQVFNGNTQLITHLEQIRENHQSFQVVPNSTPHSQHCVICTRGGARFCALDGAFTLLHELIECCKYCGLADSKFVRVFENLPWWQKNGANGETCNGL